jgi:catechol 2,3-dioxygenase-like lactoylglutathione lyase family enzyme
MAQTIAIERVDHIGIRVRDLDRALSFYRVLGFTLAHRAQGDDVAPSFATSTAWSSISFSTPMPAIRPPTF